MTKKDVPFLNRRALLTATACGAALPLMKDSTASAENAQADPRSKSPVVLSINGQSYHLDLDSRTTLLDVLREHIGLTGTKKGCDHGQCGACTVHANGKTILSCLTLALAAQGKDINTIEGLIGAYGKVHPMQE